MIYNSSPVWSIKGKNKREQTNVSPSPAAYDHKNNLSILKKSPSWKIGTEKKGREYDNNVPGPGAYQPPFVQRMTRFETIDKQNSNVKLNSTGFKENNEDFSSKVKQSEQNNNFGDCYKDQQLLKKTKGGFIGREKRFTENNETQSFPSPFHYETKRPTSASLSFTRAEKNTNLAQKETIVGPGKYDKIGIFEQNKKYQRGYSLSKKLSANVFQVSPGPADYSPSKIMLPTSPCLTISSRFEEMKMEKVPSPTQYSPNYSQIYCKAQDCIIGKAVRPALYFKKDIPGPGTYQTFKTESSNAKCMSLKMSRKIQQRNDVPGPGAYYPKKELLYKRPQSAKLGKSKRFLTIKTEVGPSPGQYESQRIPNYSFCRNKRQKQGIEETPGPGSYTMASSIGHKPAFK